MGFSHWHAVKLKNIQAYFYYDLFIYVILRTNARIISSNFYLMQRTGILTRDILAVANPKVFTTKIKTAKLDLKIILVKVDIFLINVILCNFQIHIYILFRFIFSFNTLLFRYNKLQLHDLWRNLGFLKFFVISV